MCSKLIKKESKKMKQDLILAHELDFDNLDDFYYYVYENYLLGNYKDAINFYLQLQDKKSFYSSIIDKISNQAFIQYSTFISKNIGD